MTQDLTGLRVAYLVTEYPARSHTFIRREIAALESLGATVDVFAIRRPALETLLTDDERDEHRRTTNLLPVSPLAFVASHARALATSPRRYVTTLRASTAHRLPGARNALWSLFYFGEAVVLADALRARDHQHLHAHFALASSNVGRLAMRLLGGTWSVTLHGSADFDYPSGPLLGDKIRDAAFAVCVSSYGAAQAMRQLDPNDWDKVLVSRCAIDPRELPRASTSRSDDTFRIVSVGRLVPVKGQLGLLEAFAIAKKENARLRLVLVGDGPSRARIESRARELGVESSVELVGSVSEPEALAHIARADAFALASFMEGVPLVLMEAMALRVPVVAPRVAGIPELVDDGKEGLLFHASAWSDLAEKLLRLASDEPLRERLVSAAEKKVLSEFAYPSAIAPLAEKLREIVGRSEHARASSSRRPRVR